MSEKQDKPSYPILRFFVWEHLPPHLQAVSKPFGELAHKLAEELPKDAETSVALRKLLLKGGRRYDLENALLP